ncbi:XrtB/PEP-CTERM-associated polysaccharide biosynthesis outer membrane protein EpsL [Duganella sp. P38]|uniref:XrtB/PEP-CTERM-associated polysaccharide biosynthesis outer membrane protein EpsL n=1 Tax=Duganella sp. P38 TaxID=3423949 RepID=UPI003D7A958D
MSSRNHLPTRQQLAIGVACASGMLLSQLAHADISDTIKPFAQVSIAHDDNLLRLRDGETSDGERSDTYKTVTGGFFLERPIGQQLITGRALFSRVKFDKFTQLDYNSKDILLAANWHILSHLSGNVGVSYNETLAPYSDFHSDERNLRTQRKAYWDGAWQFHPSWQVRGAVSREKFDYDLFIQRFNTRTEDAAEVGFDYLPATGSRFGLVARRLKGTYDNVLTIGGFTFDNRYVQDEIKANVYWIMSGHTRLQFLGGWERRDHPQQNRSDSGTNGRMIMTWTPTGKLNVVGSAWREFSAYEGTTIRSSLNKGVSLKTVWNATAKVSANVLLRDEKRDFDTANTTLAGIALDDNTRTAQVGLSYAPQQRVVLSLNAFREQRTGTNNPAVTTFKANGASFNASVQF